LTHQRPSAAVAETCDHNGIQDCADAGAARRRDQGTSVYTDRHIRQRAQVGAIDAKGPDMLHSLDLGTKRVSPIAGSEGIWAATWSPDGRYLLGLRFNFAR
jgi:hypothetical protein